MEARIARIESDVAHLRTDVADIKVDVRSLAAIGTRRSTRLLAVRTWTLGERECS